MPDQKANYLYLFPVYLNGVQGPRTERNILKRPFSFLLFRENVLAMLQAGQRVVDNPVYLSDLGK